jgi:hypothetical protein
MTMTTIDDEEEQGKGATLLQKWMALPQSHPHYNRTILVDMNFR